MIPFRYRRIFDRALLLAVLLLICSALSPANAEQLFFYGTGVDDSSSENFVVKLRLDEPLSAGSYSGFFNASGTLGGGSFCAKGAFQGQSNGQSLVFSFEDEDDDPGCRSSEDIIAIRAFRTADGERVIGTYSSETSVSMRSGEIRLYRADLWLGAGYNDTFDKAWDNTMRLAFLPGQRIAGELDATRNQSGTICGRGLFLGSISGGNVDFRFDSNDPDPGCGFDFGLEFLFVGELSAGATFLAGDYFIDNGQLGFWDAQNTSVFRNGFESGDTSRWSTTSP